MPIGWKRADHAVGAAARDDEHEREADGGGVQVSRRCKTVLDMHTCTTLPRRQTTTETVLLTTRSSLL